MQTAAYVILVLFGIVGLKLVSRALRRPASPLMLSVYGTTFFVGTFVLYAVAFEVRYPLEVAAVSAVCALASTCLLFVEGRRGKA